MFGLCRITAFYDRLRAEMDRADRTRRPLAVVVFQVPPFSPEKQQELDLALCRTVRKGGLRQLLRTPRQRLKQFIDRGITTADIPARLSEQRLAVILCDTRGVEAAATRIGRRLAQAGGCSVASGWARYPDDGDTVAQLLRRAIQRGKSDTPRTAWAVRENGRRH